VRDKELAEQEAREAQEREDREKRRARIFRLLFVWSFVALALTLVAGGYAFLARSEAQDKRRVAESILLAGRANEEPNAAVAAVAALEAFDLHETSEARSAVLTRLQTSAGIARVLAGHTRGITDISFGPAGVLASSSIDGTVRLWDTGTGEPIGEPLRMGVEHAPTVDSVAISPDGSLLAAACSDGRVRLWDIRQPRQPRRLGLRKPHSGDVNVVAFAGGSAPLLAAGGDLETITVWNVGNPRNPVRLPKVATGFHGVYALAFAPGGRILASGDDYGDAHLWRIDPGETPRLLTREPFRIPELQVLASLDFSPNGNLLVAGGQSPVPETSQFVVWDVSNPATPRHLESPTGHVDAVYAADFDATGARVASGGADGTVLVWDTRSWRSFGPPRTHVFGVPITGVELSPDGDTMASADDSGTIKLWKLAEPSPLARTLGWPARPTWDLAVTDGMVATANGEAGIELWPSDDGQAHPPGEPQRISAEANGASYAVKAHDSLVIGSTGSTFGIWQVSDGSVRPLGRAESGRHSGIYGIGISSDGNTAATGGYDGEIVLWDISDPRRIGHVATIESHGGRPVEDLDFSPTQPVLASAGKDGTLRLWDISDPTTPKELGEPLVAHEGEVVWTVAFGADGDLLASGGGDRRVVLWDVGDPASIERVARTGFHVNSILRLSFNREATILAVADSESAAVLYDIPSMRPLGRGVVGRVGANASFDGVAFDEDGTTLYTAGRLNPVVAWSSDLWTSDYEILRDHMCSIVQQRDLEPEEWQETFRDTELEGRYRRTCSDE
jgi:WD40 repeat protein